VVVVVPVKELVVVTIVIVVAVVVVTVVAVVAVTVLAILVVSYILFGSKERSGFLRSATKSRKSREINIPTCG
jgi:hypothetical protein